VVARHPMTSYMLGDPGHCCGSDLARPSVDQRRRSVAGRKQR
jgi:hypothetical protein